LLAIAEQTAPIGAVPSPPKQVALKAVPVPPPPVPNVKTPLRQTLGSLAGLVALVAFPLLAIMVLRQHRLTRRVRLKLQTNLAREASLSAAIAASTNLPAAVASPGSSVAMERRNYRVRRGRVPILLSSAAVVLAAAAAGYLATRASGHPGADCRRVAAARPAAQRTVLDRDRCEIARHPDRP
jgi:hypothetical protein